MTFELGAHNGEVHRLANKLQVVRYLRTSQNVQEWMQKPVYAQKRRSAMQEISCPVPKTYKIKTCIFSAGSC